MWQPRIQMSRYVEDMTCRYFIHILLALMFSYFVFLFCFDNLHPHPFGVDVFCILYFFCLLTTFIHILLAMIPGITITIIIIIIITIMVITITFIHILLALIPGITSQCSWNSSPSLTYMAVVISTRRR